MLISWHESVGSTNDVASALASEGRCSPFVVAARQQTGGRGRGGRRWVSPIGGAWLSLAWLPPAGWGGWSLAPLAVGLAVNRVVSDLLAEPLRDRVEIKWPNDVLVGGRKVGGVLCERPWAGREGHDWLIAGVGVNVSLRSASLGEGLRVPAVSLAELLDDVPEVDDVVERVVYRMLSLLRLVGSEPGRASVLSEVRGVLAWRGERVRLVQGGKAVQGCVVGLDPDGGLVLRDDTGAERVVCAGDVERLSLESETLAV
ncbi:MAG: biotin--[acetyl-CoA-carboxylase] ligase [Phycisphaeraceae bacterium]